jgi:DNA-binding MarR family transcriptional regulator
MRQPDVQLQAVHGLTLSHCEVLMFLDDAPGQQMRVTELAAGVLISPSACTRLVDRLEAVRHEARSHR